MRKVIQLSIPEPCHENWNVMSPRDKGRHCAVCEKTVIDFTHKTDEQIIKHIEREKNICGRFKGSQIDRELAYSRKDNNVLLKYVASGLLAFLALQPSQSKAQKLPNVITQPVLNTDDIQGKIATSVVKGRIVSGKVLDENMLPLPGAYISIKGTSIKTKANTEGYYKLQIENGTVLEFRFLGYITKEVAVANLAVYNVSLDIEVLTIGAVVICELTSGAPILSAEEIKEKQHLDSIRKNNHTKYYDQLFQEKIDAKKARRRHRKLNRK